MSHEIDYTGNIVRFGQSIDNRPAWWERQGEFEGGRLDPNLPAHVWRKTVLPWSVRHVPVQFTTIGTPEKPSTTVVCDDRFVNYRDDTNAHLTTNASGSYHLHSIGRIVDALDMVCKEAGFQPNTMGSLRGGKEIFMMAKTQGKELIAGERFRRYIVMGTSYDQTRLSFTYQTDMAVVVSQSQNEIALMKEKGLDIAPHRIRMVNEKLDEKFKDPDDPFRIVFVCAMWMTGFDVPSCSTIYVDKPMKNHTLMQTIARANRVFRDKFNGLIVDYVGVFRNLQRALAIYGAGGGTGEGPVLDKDRLVQALEMAIGTAEEFLKGLNVDLSSIVEAEVFQAIQQVDEAVEAVLVNDDTKKQYLNLASDVNRLFKAILPDNRANEFIGKRSAIREIERRIKSKSEPVDISEFMKDVETLLDSSVATDGYLIGTGEGADDHIKDLSQIDFDALKSRFEKGKKNSELERLKAAIDRSLSKMVEENKSRTDFKERFEQLIADYNAGSLNVDILFDELVNFTQDLNEEAERHIRENLSEEELAIFDILTKPEMELSQKETDDIKQVCRDLLNTLRAEKLVLDWKKRQNTVADVEVTIGTVLDSGLPEKFEKEVYDSKCRLIFSHVYDCYMGEGKTIYETFASTS